MMIMTTAEVSTVCADCVHACVCALEVANVCVAREREQVGGGVRRGLMIV